MTALCVSVVSGSLVVDSPQPGDLTTCAYLVLDQDTYGRVSSSPWSGLDDAGAMSIGGAVLGLWAFAWCIRQIYKQT
jgi:hypothetical protein